MCELLFNNYVHAALLSEQVSADCTVGELEVESEPNTEPGLYIDPDNPSPCTGQLTGWRYCYYEPESGNRVRINFQFHVWRFDVDDNTYRKVGQSDVSFRPPPQGRFRCRNAVLDETEYIDIKRGDLLGVFLGTPVLMVVAEAASTRRLLFATVGAQDVAAASDLEVADGLRIHLRAEISECEHAQGHIKLSGWSS